MSLGDIRPILLLPPDGLGKYRVELIDQTQLPLDFVLKQYTEVDDVIRAIRDMEVRGAPAIGIAGACGLVLSAQQNPNKQSLKQDAQRLNATRPTAVNLQWALNRMITLIDTLDDSHPDTWVPSLAQEAQRIIDEDLAMCIAMGDHGARWIQETVPIREGESTWGVLTHCNAGALATAGYGTAVGVIRSLYRDDPTLRVMADETRPRLQGASLTVWELTQTGIPVTLQADNMAAWSMKQGRVDAVVVGADRITANGDAANKIGTYMLALAAKAHNIPFYVAAPSSTFDLALSSGELIPIEHRDETEVAVIGSQRITPEGVSCYNPGFDVTPNDLITAIFTEKGVLLPPYTASIARQLG